MPVALIPYDLSDVPAGLEVHVWDSDDPLPDDDVLARVGCYVTPYTFSPHTLEIAARMPALQVLQVLTAGVEHAVAYVPAGVTLCNAHGLHDTSTAELALTLTLAALNGVPRWVRDQDRGSWVYARRDALADRRVLVVGAGSIAAAVVERLTPFECAVTLVGRTARAGVHASSELPALLPKADVVVLIVPLTDETRGLVDAAFLAAMPDGALLVNLARGPVVDTDALLVELGAGRLRAALDVTDPEPLPPDHPLWSVPGVLISPHVGGHSTAFRPRAERLIREQLGRWATGAPLANIVR